VTLAHANALRIPIADNSVQCVVTSPAYFNLRDYGLPSTEWPAVTYIPMTGLSPITIPGCDPTCEHEWSEKREITPRTWEQAVGTSTLEGGKMTQFVASQGLLPHKYGLAGSGVENAVGGEDV